MACVADEKSYPVPQQWIAEGVKQGQDYLMQNTTLGIPALVQSEGIHGFLIGNATIFNSVSHFATNRRIRQKKPDIEFSSITNADDL